MQIFGAFREEIDRLAASVLKKAVADDAVVLIHQTTEAQIDMMLKPKEKEAVHAQRDK